MSSIASAISNPISGATDFLVGGKTTKTTGYTDPQQAEQARMKEIEDALTSSYNTQSTLAASNQQQAGDITSQFSNLLSHFLAGGSSNPNPTPEQITQARDFVDKTFTNPTQNALDQYQGNYESTANARAAALGRNPNTDIATQQAIYGEGQRNTMNLQAERGSRVAQGAQDINNQTYNRGIGTLNAGMTGSNFLNNLTQQAFANKLSLLNGRSGLANYYQNERKVGQYGTSSGILTNVNSVENGLGNVMAGGSQSRKESSDLLAALAKGGG